MKTIDILIDRICDLKAPVAVGIDPVLERLPLVYLDGLENNCAGAAKAIAMFAEDVIEAVSGVVPAVKPQSAFFEMYGSAGIKALETTIAYAHEAGLIVIEDAKRNDIGNTARAYASGHLGQINVPGATVPSPYSSDFLTVSPYEGAEGLEPFLKVAAEQGRGVFVLAKTSNIGSMAVQGARGEDGMTVYETIASYLAQQASKDIGKHGYSSIGAVVGATYPEQAARLRKIMPQSFFLVPGYGAQGAGSKEVLPCFNDDGLGAVVNASRSVIYAYEKTSSASCSRADFKVATRDAAIAMRDDIYGVIHGNVSNPLY